MILGVFDAYSSFVVASICDLVIEHETICMYWSAESSTEPIHIASPNLFRLKLSQDLRHCCFYNTNTYLPGMRCFLCTAPPSHISICRDASQSLRMPCCTLNTTGYNSFILKIRRSLRACPKTDSTHGKPRDLKKSINTVSLGPGLICVAV